MSLSGMALAEDSNANKAEADKAVATAKLDRVLAVKTGALMRLKLSAEQEQKIHDIRRDWAKQRALMVQYRAQQHEALKVLKATEGKVDKEQVKKLEAHLKQVRKAINDAKAATWVPLVKVLDEGQREQLAKLLRADFGQEYVEQLQELVRHAFQSEADAPQTGEQQPGEEAAEQERIEREAAEKAAQAERERIEAEEAEKAAQAERERIEAEQAENGEPAPAEQPNDEAAEKERIEREAAEKAAQAERERIEAEQAENGEPADDKTEDGEPADSGADEGAGEPGEEAPEPAEGENLKQKLEQMMQAFEDLRREHSELQKAFGELHKAPQDGGEGESEAPEQAPEDSPEQDDNNK